MQRRGLRALPLERAGAPERMLRRGGELRELLRGRELLVCLPPGRGRAARQEALRGLHGRLRGLRRRDGSAHG